MGSSNKFSIISLIAVFALFQLRAEAGKRQVDGASVALQHNYGIGGAAVVTMYRKYKPQSRAHLHAKL